MIGVTTKTAGIDVSGQTEQNVGLPFRRYKVRVSRVSVRVRLGVKVRVRVRLSSATRNGGPWEWRTEILDVRHLLPV